MSSSDPTTAGAARVDPTAAAPSPQALRQARKAVIASSVGNALEWFDIIVYSSFAVVISELFFPDVSGFAALMFTFLTFAVSYLVRPVGAMVLGSWADRVGRRRALSLTILLMMAGTGLMALAPTAAVVGPVAAGTWLLVSRLVQGFSAGGEFGSATTFLVETAPHRKAFYGSWQVATQGGALLLASGFGFALTTLLSHDALYSWGWRVPFVVGMLIGPVGFYIRRRMDETEEFRAAEKESSPLGAAVTTHLTRLLTAAGAVALASLSVYLILYMPTFAVKSLGLPDYAGFLGGFIAGVVTLAGTPFIGRLADHVGPGRVMLVAAAAAAVAAWPLFQLVVAVPSVAVLTVVQVVFGALMAAYFGPLPGLYAELFPTNVRGTGMSVGYNLGVLVFGGFTGAIFTFLIETTGSKTSPSIYFVVIAALSFTTVAVARRTFGVR
ncbi:MFS transporter [Phycicoccus endophyticus]|uniref:MFS transporter n=1 Tax=Phycicoccus endophyticus TaxID=1690220 RepID=A0A7G9QYD3_9MICO|nr:MFS transporter [Phycicoccus endophyticus]NHI19252.1 MFS transporter [Phycicoccus endophyticus]QNN48358.1 MFS transporter [Phycicoccus endophyticus]GGL41322.1 MFS transporter [Phycicoccus endophyticus]